MKRIAVAVVVAVLIALVVLIALTTHLDIEIQTSPDVATGCAWL